MANQPILVIGATGQQGGAVARELLSRGRAVWAFTHSPNSPAAQALAERGARLVQGDLDDPASIRAPMSGAAAVFSVQTHLTPAGVEGEVRQGKAVAEAARQAGITQLVYSSVDGAERQSGIPHFESRWEVEQHLRALGVPTTVLRPTMFMDNFATVQRPQTLDRQLLVRLALSPDDIDATEPAHRRAEPHNLGRPVTSRSTATGRSPAPNSPGGSCLTSQIAEVALEISGVREVLAVALVQTRDGLRPVPPALQLAGEAEPGRHDRSRLDHATKRQLVGLRVPTARGVGDHVPRWRPN